MGLEINIRIEIVKKDGSELVKQDVYVYQIKVKFLKKGTSYYTGNVSLIR